MAIITAPLGCRYVVAVTNTLQSLRTLLVAAGAPDTLWQFSGQFPGAAQGSFGIRIAAQTVNGTDRVAMIIASPRYTGTPLQYADLASTDASTHGEYIPAGQEYYNPMDVDVLSGLITVTGSANANITLYIR